MEFRDLVPSEAWKLFSLLLSSDCLFVTGKYFYSFYKSKSVTEITNFHVFKGNFSVPWLQSFGQQLKHPIIHAANEKAITGTKNFNAATLAVTIIC